MTKKLLYRIIEWICCFDEYESFGPDGRQGSFGNYLRISHCYKIVKIEKWNSFLVDRVARNGLVSNRIGINLVWNWKRIWYLLYRKNLFGTTTLRPHVIEDAGPITITLPHPVEGSEPIEIINIGSGTIIVKCSTAHIESECSMTFTPKESAWEPEDPENVKGLYDKPEIWKTE